MKLAVKQEEKSQESEAFLSTAFERKKHFDCPKAKAHFKSPKKYPACEKAHNPLQLELIPVTDKISNLKGVIQASKDQMS